MLIQNESLIEAITNGDGDAILDMLKSGLDPNSAVRMGKEEKPLIECISSMDIFFIGNGNTGYAYLARECFARGGKVTTNFLRDISNIFPGHIEFNPNPEKNRLITYLRAAVELGGLTKEIATAHSDIMNDIMLKAVGQGDYLSTELLLSLGVRADVKGRYDETAIEAIASAYVRKRSISNRLIETFLKMLDSGVDVAKIKQEKHHAIYNRFSNSHKETEALRELIDRKLLEIHASEAAHNNTQPRKRNGLRL